jgi:hypothetical protein
MNMEKNTLCIGDLSFEVDDSRSSFHALISNATDFKLFWMVSIGTRLRPVQIADDTSIWQPTVYWESIENSVRDWKELEGEVFHAENLRGDGPAIYISSHEDLDRCELRFLSRRGTRFEIAVAFSWIDYFGYFGPDERTILGSAHTIVNLKHVTVWLENIRTEEEARVRLQQDLDLSTLKGPTAEVVPNCGPKFRFEPIA